jgi:hypothetical protein
MTLVSEDFLVELEWFLPQNKICPFLRQCICIFFFGVNHSWTNSKYPQILRILNFKFIWQMLPETSFQTINVYFISSQNRNSELLWNKDWLARNQNNVSEWSDMFTRGLLFKWTRTIKIQLSVLV